MFPSKIDGNFRYGKLFIDTVCKAAEGFKAGLFPGLSVTVQVFL